MCGVTGFVDTRSVIAPLPLKEVVVCMADQLVHRGPDRAGAWSDDNHRVALGHRRLSIIDLSKAGSQPMVSSSGRYVIVYNGEVYNFPDIRADLEVSNISFKGQSYTEVILEAIDCWGFEETRTRLIGMFESPEPNVELSDCRDDL